MTPESSIIFVITEGRKFVHLLITRKELKSSFLLIFWIIAGGDAILNIVLI